MGARLNPNLEWHFGENGKIIEDNKPFNKTYIPSPAVRLPRKEKDNMINYEELDEKVRDMVKFFNDIGLKTKFSCEGHGGTMGTDFYIMFDECVEDKDITNFLIKCSEDWKHTPLIGVFHKWIRKVNGKIESNWMYICSYGDVEINQISAQRDLRFLKERKEIFLNE